MTYREILKRIFEMNDEQLDQAATAYLSVDGEFFPISSLEENEEGPELDVGHPFFII